MDQVFVGRVRYIDHLSDSEQVPEEDNLYAPFLCKSMAYAHECEIRAIFANMSFFDRPGAPPGYFVPIDVQELVEQGVVSPVSPPWFDGIVKSICERFGYSLKVERSVVYGAPVFRPPNRPLQPSAPRKSRIDAKQSHAAPRVSRNRVRPAWALAWR